MRWAFFISWWYCFILFPTWYVFPGREKHYMLTLFLVYFLCNWYLLFRWIEIPKGNRKDVLDSVGNPIELSSPDIMSGHSIISLKLNYIKLNTGLIILLLISLILQIYPMTLPIETVGDEHYHSYVSIPILSALSSRVNISFPLLGWIIVVISGGIVWVLHSIFKKVQKNLIGLSVSVIVVLTLLYVYLLERIGIVAHLAPLKHLVRFPPLGKTVNLFFYALFGVNEFTARLPQLIFYLLSSIYMYRLLLLFRNEQTALLGSAFLLFIPGFFYYGHMAYLTGGVIFLVTSSIFYFLRYIKENRKEDFIMAIFLSSVGFLYKRVLLALFLTFFFYLSLRVIWRKKLSDKPSFYLKFFWLGLVPVIPWLYLGYRFSERNYNFLLSNWTSLGNAIAVFKQMPKAITYPMFFLFILGMIYSLWKKRDELTYFLILWFCTFYIFINSDTGSIVRLALPLYVAVVVLTAQFIGEIFKKKRAIFLSSLFIFCFYLLSTSLFFNLPPLKKKYTLLTNLKTNIVPYPQAMKYIKVYIPKGTRIYAPMGCEPSHFYLYYYGLQDKIYWERKIWVEDKKKQSVDSLYHFCKMNNFDYLLLPQGKWLKAWINPKVAEELFREKDKRFEKEKIFTYGINEMILYKVK